MKTKEEVIKKIDQITSGDISDDPFTKEIQDFLMLPMGFDRRYIIDQVWQMYQAKHKWWL